MINTQQLEPFRHGVVAGAAGGLAEIAWVTLYAGLTGGNPALLARGVTSAAGVSALLPASPAALGVAVHMTLAVTLGIALAVAWQKLREHRPAATTPYPFMLAALAAVWALNFLFVLPIISPAFVHIVPYTVSLTSKLLFGMAAAVALQGQAASTLASGQRSRPRNPIGVRWRQRDGLAKNMVRTDTDDSLKQQP